MIGIKSSNSPSLISDFYGLEDPLGTNCNEKSSQCGKIFLYENNVFIFTCIFCELSSFTNIEEFIKHVTCFHTNIHDSEELIGEIPNTNHIGLNNEIIETTELIFDDIINDSSVSSENHNESKNVDDFNNFPSPNCIKYEIELYDSEAENVLDLNENDTINNLTTEETKVRTRNRKEIIEFYCTICNRNLKSQKILDRHVDECHNNFGVNLENTNKKITCEHCNRDITKVTFENHKSVCMARKNATVIIKNEDQTIQSKKDKIVFAEPINVIENKKRCRYCRRRFKTPYDLELHEKSHTDEKKFQCECCNKRFFTIFNLRMHMKMHKQTRPFKCDICDATFVLRSNLLVHIRRHNGDKRHKCGLCDKKFISSSEKRSHERSHTGDKPYKCDYCEQRFQRSSVLLNHLRKQHSENKEYKCTQCDKEYFTPSDLKHHVILHGEKKFECVICDAKFFRKRDLRVHMRTHQNEKSYLCSMCGMGFNTRTGLNIHVKKHH